MSRNLSLFDGGLWLIERYPDEAATAGWAHEAGELKEWMDRPVRIRFWSGELCRHLEFEEPFRGILGSHANLLKHNLLKLGVELRRLQRRCARSGAQLTDAQVVGARDEYAAHLKGMMEYHATEVAERVGRYFLGFYRFVCARYERNPTNNLDEMAMPSGMTDNLFRYLYASTIFSFAGWKEERLMSSIPETGLHFKPPYPQHEDSNSDQG